MRLAPLALLTAVLLFPGGVQAEDAPSEASSSTEARLVLDVPEGARVWIDRAPQGAARAFSYPMPAGGVLRKYVTIRLHDGGTARRTAHLKPGRETRVRVRGPSMIVLQVGRLPRLVDPASGHVRPLVDDERFHCDPPLLSPDGGLIAVRRRERLKDFKLGNDEAVLLTSDGKLVRALGDLIHMAWSPDGTRIAYARHARLRRTFHDPWHGSYDLHVTDVADGHEIRLTEGSAPRWTPDGAQVLFERTRNSPAPNTDTTHRIDAQGGTVLPWPHEPLYLTEWSPDGTRVVFSRKGAGASSASVYIARADGTGLRRLSEGGAATWSPGGDLICFRRSLRPRSGTRTYLHVMRPDGTSRKALTPGYGAAWSPDGRRLAFLRNGGDTQGFISPDDLFVIGRDGRGMRRITRLARSRLLQEPTRREKATVLDFAWGPHGRRLAYVVWRGHDYGPWVKGTMELYLVNADGSGLQRVLGPTASSGGSGDVATFIHWH